MQRQIIVSGFHRSGTSMTMQALVNAGLYAGNSLIGGDPSNPDGHFEDIDTVNLHDAWLRELGSDWCHTGELPQIEAAKATLGIAPIRDRLNESQRHWGVKDPRTCLFLKHWFNTLDNPAGVFIYRHYASCLHSLQRRQANELLVYPTTSENAIRFWTKPEIALQSWLQHNNAILTTAREFPKACVVVSQEAVINGAPLISTVNDVLSLSLDTQCDLGVDASKTAHRRELPLLNSSLQGELEETWAQLQHIAALPNEQEPQLRWIQPQCVTVQHQATPASLVAQWDRLGVTQSQSALRISDGS
ncbi:MAG: hypothetical protein V3U65_06365 [Granulosicoccaceae bacterium]